MAFLYRLYVCSRRIDQDIYVKFTFVEYYFTKLVNNVEHVEILSNSTTANFVRLCEQGEQQNLRKKRRQEVYQVPQRKTSIIV